MSESTSGEDLYLASQSWCTRELRIPGDQRALQAFRERHVRHVIAAEVRSVSPGLLGENGERPQFDGHPVEPGEGKCRLTGRE